MGITMIYEVSLCLFFVSTATIALEPRGCNVCYREEMVVIQRNYSLRESHNLIVRDNKPCPTSGSTPRPHHWCKNFHLIEEEKKMVKYCCEGYYMDDADLRCKPVCRQGCYKGDCIEPDKCRCHPGWRGDLCDSGCPPEKWGYDCEKNCYCQNGGICDPITGACTCSKGWRGQNCSEPCLQGSHGSECKELCRCQNNALCDHITGRCNCTAGYQGPLCEKKCNGTHGYQCLDECKCQNDAFCHHEDGTCECTPGWTGPVCADACENGSFGKDCSSVCKCYNNGSCNPVTGECTCPAGFYGEGCELECTPGTWGLKCLQDCNCSHGTCDRTDGKCLCFLGFNGTSCEDRVCPSNKWGEECSNDCSCIEGIECHPVTGECWCTSGEEADCSIQYSENFEKQVMGDESTEGVNIWKIISVVCVSLIMLQLIVVGAIYCKKHTVIHIRNQDASLLPSYSELSKEEHH